MDNILNSFLLRPWKAYCISLPRCTERRERFSSWARDIGLTFTFWDAVDKHDLTEATVISGNEWSLGATACRKSHEALWQHCLEEKTPFVFLLEDDAEFLSKTLQDFQTFVEDIQKSKRPWSVLQFGFGTMTGVELHLLSKRINPGIFQTDFCDQTHALLYTEKAVQDMLLLAQEEKFKTRPSDGLLLTYIQKKKGNVLCPKTSILEQTDTISYISH